MHSPGCIEATKDPYLQQQQGQKHCWLAASLPAVVRADPCSLVPAGNGVWGGSTASALCADVSLPHVHPQVGALSHTRVSLGPLACWHCAAV